MNVFMTLTLELTAELEARLSQEAASAGMPLESYVVGVLSQQRPDGDRREDLTSELQSWIDGAACQTPNDEVLELLDADRPSDRPLYPADLKGVTW